MRRRGQGGVRVTTRDGSGNSQSVLCLVVSSQHVEACRAGKLGGKNVKRVRQMRSVLAVQATCVYLQREQREDGLKREGAAVDKVAVEEVRVGGGREAAQREDVAQVVKLPVRVPAHVKPPDLLLVVAVRVCAVAGARAAAAGAVGHDGQREAQQRGRGLQVVARRLQHLDHVLAVHQLLPPEAFDAVAHELQRHLQAVLPTPFAGRCCVAWIR